MNPCLPQAQGFGQGLSFCSHGPCCCRIPTERDSKGRSVQVVTAVIECEQAVIKYVLKFLTSRKFSS